VGYAAFQGHCSLFPMSGAVIEAFAAELNGRQTSKGTIRFPVDEPLPAARDGSELKADVELHGAAVVERVGDEAEVGRGEFAEGLGELRRVA
jgi:hypothetical protein